MTLGSLVTITDKRLLRLRLRRGRKRFRQFQLAAQGGEIYRFGLCRTVCQAVSYTSLYQRPAAALMAVAPWAVALVAETAWCAVVTFGAV